MNLIDYLNLAISMKMRLSMLSAAITLTLSGASLGQKYQTTYTEWGVPDLRRKLEERHSDALRATS